VPPAGVITTGAVLKKAFNKNKKQYAVLFVTAITQNQQHEHQQRRKNKYCLHLTKLNKVLMIAHHQNQHNTKTGQISLK
jgi:anti-sigma factor ChrR (cupin superfamily)